MSYLSAAVRQCGSEGVGSLRGLIGPPCGAGGRAPSGCACRCHTGCHHQAGRAGAPLLIHGRRWFPPPTSAFLCSTHYVVGCTLPFFWLSVCLAALVCSLPACTAQCRARGSCYTIFRTVNNYNNENGGPTSSACVTSCGIENLRTGCVQAYVYMSHVYTARYTARYLPTFCVHTLGTAYIVQALPLLSCNAWQLAAALLAHTAGLSATHIGTYIFTGIYDGLGGRTSGGPTGGWQAGGGGGVAQAPSWPL